MISGIQGIKLFFSRTLPDRRFIFPVYMNFFRNKKRDGAAPLSGSAHHPRRGRTAASLLPGSYVSAFPFQRPIRYTATVVAQPASQEISSDTKSISQRPFGFSGDLVAKQSA